MKLLLSIPIAALLFASPSPDGPMAAQPLAAHAGTTTACGTVRRAGRGYLRARCTRLEGCAPAAGGREIPYATDVSFDDRTGEAGAPPPDDRAQYETVGVLPLSPSRNADGSGQKPGHYFTEDLLSAHVPQSVFVWNSSTSQTQLGLRAAARMNLAQAEELHTTLGPGRAAAPFTMRANLQDEADISVSVAEQRRGHSAKVRGAGDASP